MTDAHYDPIRPLPRTTNAPGDDQAVANFRIAFAVLGALVASGEIHIDFRDEGWAAKFEVLTATIAAVLNEFNG